MKRSTIKYNKSLLEDQNNNYKRNSSFDKQHIERISLQFVSLCYNISHQTSSGSFKVWWVYPSEHPNPIERSSSMPFVALSIQKRSQYEVHTSLFFFSSVARVFYSKGISLLDFDFKSWARIWASIQARSGLWGWAFHIKWKHWILRADLWQI